MSKYQRLPPLRKLKQIFDFDPIAGVLLWKSGDKAGGVAGNTSSSRYVQVRVDGVEYHAHRILYSLYHDRLIAPYDLIDHVDGVKNHNNYNNLRRTTTRKNARNRTPTREHPGITERGDGKWQVRITDYTGKRLVLGTFTDFQEACRVRSAAEIKYGYTQHAANKPEELPSGGPCSIKAGGADYREESRALRNIRSKQSKRKRK